MLAYRSDNYDNLTLYGGYEDIEPPDWAGFDWPLVMVVNGYVLSRFVEIANMIDRTAPSKAIMDDEDYYVYPAVKGEVTEHGAIPTGLNYKIFDSNGFPMFSYNGLPFEVISLFNKE